MTSTPPRLGEDTISLAESWVEVGCGSVHVQQQYPSQQHQWQQQQQSVTPPARGNTPLALTSDEYLRLLREAQRDSTHVSSRASLASSKLASPKQAASPSPKSPPNSPNPEFNSDLDQLHDFYINKGDNSLCFSRVSDWPYDWSSRPDLTPPKKWQKYRVGGAACADTVSHIVSAASAARCDHDRDDRNDRVSVSRRHRIFYTFVFTNLVSLLLGAGIGYLVSKKLSTNCIQLIPLD